MTRIATAVSTAAAALIFSLAAQALPITVEYTGFANGSKTGDIYGVRNVRVQAGEFTFNVKSGDYWDDPLRGFCIDVGQNLVTSGEVAYNLVHFGDSSRINSQQISLLGQLYDSHAASLGSALHDAAFQLSIWEIMYDYTGSLSLTSGGTQNFWSSSFDGARALAQTWLGGLQTGIGYSSSQYDFYVLEPLNPTRNQTILVARPIPVPEPGTIALVALGLLATAFVLGRRRQEARARR